MRDYLKILSSISAALLSFALLASAIFGINALVSGSPHTAELMFLPFAFAWAGFVMFGITGSVFWLGLLSVLGKRPKGPMKRQILAASLSTLLSWLALGLAMFPGQLTGVLESIVLLVLVVPVVAVSLLWYWFLYLRPKLGKPNRGDR